MAQDMLANSMIAFGEPDAALAASLVKWDDQVDHIFNKLYKEIVGFAAASPNAIAYANQLEWTIHNMERSADRVINICEWVVYLVTGIYREFDSEYEAAPSSDQLQS